MIIPLLGSNGKYSLWNTRTNSKHGWGEYDYLDFFKEGYAKFRIDNKWGFITSDERILKLQYDYENIQAFENGLAAVERDGLWRFINRNGIEMTIRGYYEYHSLGRGFVEVTAVGRRGIDMSSFQGDTYPTSFCTGVIDNTGFEIISPQKECTISVEDNFIVVSGNKYYEVVSLNGEKISYSQDYEFISTFYKNRAIAISKVNSELLLIDETLSKVKSFGFRRDYGLCECYTIGGRIVDGFINGLYTLRLGNKWGVINLKGDLCCDYKYDILYPFIGNVAIAGKIIDQQIKYTLLNTQCKELIPFKYDKIELFSEGHAAVALNGMWGMIDANGNEVIPTIFTKVGICKNGIVDVSLGDYKNGEYFGKYGLYNISGEKICPLIYESVRSFDTSLSIVQMDGKYGFLDDEGREVTKIKYDRIIGSHIDFHFVEEAGKRFVVNKIGHEYIDF
jgi:hypothetical protein